MNSNDRAIVAFTMIGHAMFHLYELAIPLFVVYWLVAFDVSAAVIGTLVGGGLALIGLGAIASGVLADEYGSKTLVTTSILGMGGSFLLIGVSPRLEVLALALLVWGAASSLYHPAALSLLTRGTEEQGTALAYHGAAGNVGTAAGPFVAAVLLTFVRWEGVAISFVIPAVVAVAMAFRFDFDETAGVDSSVEEPTGDGSDGDSMAASDGAAAEATTDRSGTTPTTDGVTDTAGFLAQSKHLFSGGFVVAFAIMMVHGLYARGVLSFLPEILAGIQLFAPIPIRGETFEPSQYVFAGLLLLGAGGQYVGGKLTDRTRTEYALIGTYAVLVFATLAFPPASSAGIVPMLVVCGALGATIYMSAPIRQALLAEYSAANVRGLSFGYFYLGVYGVGAIGTSLAGVVLTYGSTGTFFVFFAAIAAIAVVLGLLLLRVFADETMSER